MTAAPAVHAAAQVALLFAPGTAVIVGGIPGAGKTTFLARTVRPGDAIVLDSADVRRRLRARLGRGVPYALYRPVVHAVHLLRVWRALAVPAPVVVHDCATRGPLRRLMRRRAARAGRPVCLLLLDVDPAVARGGQDARGRRVRARAMRRHERRWGRLVEGAPPHPRPGLLAEGFDGVRVLDRRAADAVAALRFG
ncbi:MAG TPA: AAA family ATPase [Solirubrobacteraceae bacterium]|nr:AAA family ATPase [Solirubrobacteraceae bacterium]